MRKIAVLFVSLVLAFAFASCGNSTDGEKIEVKVFAAASLTSVMDEFETEYEAENPNVDIVLSTDSSGVLMQQIEEGAPCDIFFCAGQSQMDELEGKGMVVDGTRQNVVNNQLVVITQPDSETKVTGLENLGDASSLALCDGSVPVGKYTRRALVNIGTLDKTDTPEAYTTDEVSKALGGVEISEQGNVSKVLSAIEEGSCEVGTTYYSDTYGHEEKIKILQTVDYEVAGDIIYPIASISNEDASDAEISAAADFLAYITNDAAKEKYSSYLFDVNVE